MLAQFWREIRMRTDRENQDQKMNGQQHGNNRDQSPAFLKTAQRFGPATSDAKAAPEGSLDFENPAPARTPDRQEQEQDAKANTRDARHEHHLPKALQRVVHATSSTYPSLPAWLPGKFHG